MKDFELFGNVEQAQNFLDSVKSGQFLLSFVMSYTQTCEIPGITIAGADSNSMKYTPPADAEYLHYGYCKTIDNIPMTPDGKLFSGDTLFVGNCGRIDLPGGSASELYHSLFDVLHSLDDDLVMYPGHNYGSTETSTIGKEKMTNMIMQKRTEQQFLDMMG